MKIVIDIPEEIYKFIKISHFYGSGGRSGRTIEQTVINGIRNGTPYEERPQDKRIEEIIEELESRKDYGVEYGQAMEDVIVILKAQFGMAVEND